MSPPNGALSDLEFRVAAIVRGSRLFALGGYAVARGLLSESLQAELLAESRSLRGRAQRTDVSESDATENRGGSPARRFSSAPAGHLHRDLHTSPRFIEAIRRLCGVAVCAGGGGTYSYYEQAGDFLALHRDVEHCDVASLTYLTPSHEDRTAGSLVVYSSFRDSTLSQTRAAGRSAGTVIAAARGDTVLLFGGITPHEVTPIASERIVAIQCYHLNLEDA